MYTFFLCGSVCLHARALCVFGGNMRHKIVHVKVQESLRPELNTVYLFCVCVCVWVSASVHACMTENCLCPLLKPSEQLVSDPGWQLDWDTSCCHSRSGGGNQIKCWQGELTETYLSILRQEINPRWDVQMISKGYIPNYVTTNQLNHHINHSHVFEMLVSPWCDVPPCQKDSPIAFRLWNQGCWYRPVNDTGQWHQANSDL